MNLTLPTLVFTTCLKVKKDERILIVTDDAQASIAADFFQAAGVFSKNISVYSVADMTENGQEPSDEISQAMLNCDIALLITTYSLSHTKSRVASSENGARIISMPGITEEILNRSVDVDYDDQVKRTDALTAILTQGSKVTITSPGGTHVHFSIDGRTAEGDTGMCTKPGDFINLPAGEAFVAPLETTAQGAIVFDGAIASIPLDKPVTLRMKNGSIESLEGGSTAKLFETRLDAAGRKARTICEFGIGTNSKAIPSPEILEAEKVFGTCHIAFGRNTTFGGINDVPFHTDGLILRPTITIDGSIIMKDGVLLNL